MATEHAYALRNVVALHMAQYGQGRSTETSPTILLATFSSRGYVLVRRSFIFFLTTGGVSGRERGQTELGTW